MSILLAVTLAATTSMQPSCSWDRPGANPYTGSPQAAIDRYTDIPEAVRATLKHRISEGLSDDKVSITRDDIIGKNKYDPTIHDMHFGSASMCGTVTRSKWAANRIEPAAVYCVDQHCILVPRICGNVSRITRLTPAVAAVPPVVAKEKPADTPKSMALNNPDREELPLEEPDAPSERKNVLASRTPGDTPEFVMEEELDLDSLGRGYLHGINLDNGGEGAATAVPEAQSWAMMFAGLGVVGLLARRRNADGRADRHAV